MNVFAQPQRQRRRQRPELRLVIVPIIITFRVINAKSAFAPSHSLPHACVRRVSNLCARPTNIRSSVLTAV